jgi:hypothetical protein
MASLHWFETIGGSIDGWVTHAGSNSVRGGFPSPVPMLAPFKFGVPTDRLFSLPSKRSKAIGPDQ